MTDEAVPPEAPPPPVVPPEPPPAPPPPKRRFFRPLLFWYFVFLMPISIIAATLAMYVHEFAHGLVALMTGGHFLGIIMGRSDRRTPSMAYADAWSDGHETAVFLAGIVVCVAIGSAVLWKGFRPGSVLKRLVLLVVASAFLMNLEYAWEGALYWKSTDYDTAQLLKTADSSALRWAVILVLLPVIVAKTLLIGRALFRCWEELFGPFSGWQSFWIILLMGLPPHFPTVNVEGAVWGGLTFAALQILLLVRLIRGRRSTVDPAPTGSVAGWAWANWGGAAIATAAVVWLFFGVQVGTFTDATVLDLHPERKTVAGTVFRYGPMDRYGERPASRGKLFLSTPEGPRIVNSPVDKVLGLAWIPSSNQFLLASSHDLYQVDIPSGEIRIVWDSRPSQIKGAKHGPGGEMALVVERWSLDWPPKKTETSLYTYDPRAKRGKVHPANGEIGNPWFAPGSPARAYVTVGQDVWVLTWPADDEGEVEVEREGGGSSLGWLEGISSDRRWWYDQEGWRSGDVRVRHENLANWGAGRDGFYTLHENGQWRLTAFKADGARQGAVKSSSVMLLQFHQGVPWIVLRNGDVRRLEEDTPEFRAAFPDLKN